MSETFGHRREGQSTTCSTWKNGLTTQLSNEDKNGQTNCDLDADFPQQSYGR